MSNLQRLLESEIMTMHPLNEIHRNALYLAASDPLIWVQHPKHDRWKKEVFDDFFDVALKNTLAFATEDKSTGEIIGSSRYKVHDELDSAVEIGWTFLARSHWGGKWNAEMKHLMISNAHEYYNDVLLCIDADNLRSARAAEKIGAELVTDFRNPLFDKRVNYLTYKVSKRIKQ